jgi:nicotinate-nucleotide pyrophosphorylase (carboxylating)
MSGIATLTSKFAAAVQGTKAKILDTRKTTPGLRLIEKYAVRCGGGLNHRMGLYDMVMIKDNHIVAAGSIAGAVRAAGQSYPELPLEVECQSLEQVSQVIRTGGVDRIMLDNMSIEKMKEAVLLVVGKIELEASGGVNLDTVRQIALTGVDFISVGALTHSAKALDISLDFI